MTRVLLLGGTTEAGEIARALADAGIDAIYSYAGRTAQPVPQPLPTRIGGFGAVAGLEAFLQDHGITHVIDATHPFAGQMSLHALAACAACGLPLIGYEREPWQAGPDDRWIHVPDLAGALSALPSNPARVFLAIGKQGLSAFAARPEHHYLLRLVDPPDAPLPLPDCVVELARGPFTLEGDLALLRRHRISVIVAKNAGGRGAVAKLAAARQLGLPVILIERPRVDGRAVAGSVGAVMDWLHQPTRRGV